MPTSTTAPVPQGAPPRRGKEWLTEWDPENEETWDSKLAWRTLSITTYNLILAFIAWFLVSAIAPRLNNIGFDLSKAQLYWLVAMPGLAGGLLRMVWMFLPPILGTRKLVTYSTLMLLIPMAGWGWAVQDASTPYAVLLVLACLSGIGGGLFSGFMPSTSYFFPKSKQGTALGIQAGIGNFGVSVVQFLVPWVIGFALLGTAAIHPQEVVKATGAGTGSIWLHNAGLVFIPWVLLGALLAWTLLKSVPVQANIKQQMDIFGEKHTWIMTVLYLMTFGAFSGLAAQFGLLTKNLFGGFPDAPDPLAYVFLGPLVGSVARIAWGPLCDRFGGAIWTVIAGVGMTVSTVFTCFFLSPTSVAEFPWFLAGMLGIFLFAGIGNASTFKQIPMIFDRRQAGGVIGWTSAVAAFGPFLLGVALASFAPRQVFIGVAVFFAGCVWLAWHYYARPGAERPS